MNAYRSDARERRKRIIKLAPSVLRLLGMIVGPPMIALGVFVFLSHKFDALGATIALLGAAVLGVLVHRFPRRRLVLDEQGDVVQLEHRTFFLWRKDWAFPLEELREVTTAKDTRDVVVRTRVDQEVTIVEDSLQNDDEVARAVDAFLRRD